MKEWFQLMGEVAPSVVRIETPLGSGTGFLCAYNDARTLTAIATAHHVVEEADKWQQPIRIRAGDSAVLLHGPDRVILPDRDRATDSAVIISATEALKALGLPKDPIALAPPGKHLKVGVEVGWLGYPGIGPQTLCFFSGKISAWQQVQNRYLIDGVAIHGVSGGPVFFRTAEGADIIGAITQYMANRLTGESLPGLSVAQDVSHFHKIITDIKNRDEAERKKKEQEQFDEAPPSTTALPRKRRG